MNMHDWLKRSGVALLLGMSLAAQAQLSYVRINELQADNQSYTNADGTVTDWVELYNVGTIAVDLGNCSLTDSNLYPRRYVFPLNTYIQAKGFLFLKCSSDTNLAPLPTPVLNTGFGLDRKGGMFYLKDPSSTLDVDVVTYGLQVTDYSLGRQTDGVGAWGLTRPTPGRTNAPAALSPASALKINEWMADPKSGDDWFEIYNPGTNPVSIGLIGFNKSTLATGAYLLTNNSFLGAGPEAGYLRLWAAGGFPLAFPVGAVNFKLGKTGDTISMWGTNSLLIDQVTFGAQSQDVSQGRLPDGGAAVVNFTNFFNFSVNTFSPGKPNFLIYTNIVISELLAHTDPPMEDALEFQNVGNTSVDISGWWLSNNELNPKKVLVPPGPPIPPGGFRVLYEYQFNADQAEGLPPGYRQTNILDSIRFNSAHGDSCYLFQTDASGKPTGYRVQEEAFESSENGVPFVHYNTSTPGDYKFVAESRRTFGVDDPADQAEFRTGTGLSNAYPVVGPVVINELMYAPTNTVYGTNITAKQNPDEEYVELANTSSRFVALYNYKFPTNCWRLRKAVSYTFPPFSYINPNSIVLVVGFDPVTNAAALANLRTKFSIPTTTPVYGPWDGRLSDTGDAIELYWPDDTQVPPHPDAGYTPYIRADKVNYMAAHIDGWQAALDGRSLQRKSVLAFGNDPINWAPGAPTPGRANLPTLIDTDGDGMPDVWETTYGLNPADPSDGAKDKEGDGLSNLQEYIAGTNPTNAASRLALSLPVAYHDVSNTFVTLRFPAASNKSYTIQHLKSVEVVVEGTNNGIPQTRVAPALWQKLTNIPAGLERVVEVTDKNSLLKTTNNFYRIVTPADL